MAGNEPPRLAILERFLERKDEGRLFARLRFESESDRPPTLGRILVRENQGSASARKRRAKVLERLRSGKFASPRLLEHLLDPSRVQPVTAKLETFLRKNRKKSLEERQAEAVAKAAKLPALLLIQGPPGTGKTEVIVELVHELRARYGERQEGVGPFRVLIAGAHNDAVKNAFRRLDGMVVRVVTAEKQEQTSLEEQSARRGQDIARKARARIAGSVTFQLIQAQRELRDRLVLARRAILDSGVEQAMPRLAELVEMGLERLLTGSHLQELQALLGRLEALRSAAECAPARDEGSAAVSAALQRLVQVPLPGPGASPTALLAPLGELEAAREAVLSSQETLSEELLLQADAWLSLKPRIEQAVNRGSGWSQALHARAAELVRMEVLPSDPSPPAASTPTVHEEVLHSLEREGLLWCEEALRLISGQLTELMRREEVVLDQWIRALEEDPRLFHTLQSTYAPISAATCQKAADTLDAEDDFYDVVIVDEAARAGIDVLIPMALGRHVILVGDHRQLPPYVEEQIWRQLDSGLQERVDMGSSLFDWLRQRLPKENFIALDKQFRMHEEIGRLVSRAFYEPEVVLRHHWEGPRAEERKLDLGLFGNQPTVWVDTKDRPDKECDCNEENGYEEEVIFKLLESIPREKLSALREKHGAVPIAVLAFYKRQRQRLEERLLSKPSWLREAVEITTVQSSQGREFPLVLIATTKSTRQRKIGFLKDQSSANVAISRAQSQVIILGDSETLAAEQHGRGEPPWRKVFGLLQIQSVELPSPNIVLASEVRSWT
nr:AAA domain-containing protein [Archangium primigenium]